MTPRLQDLGELLTLILGYIAVAMLALILIGLMAVILTLIWYICSGQYWQEVKRRQAEQKRALRMRQAIGEDFYASWIGDRGDTPKPKDP